MQTRQQKRELAELLAELQLNPISNVVLQFSEAIGSLCYAYRYHVLCYCLLLTSFGTMAACTRAYALSGKSTLFSLIHYATDRLFLALALPPYLLFYRLPRYIASRIGEGLKWIAHTINVVLTKAQQTITRLWVYYAVPFLSRYVIPVWAKYLVPLGPLLWQTLQRIDILLQKMLEHLQKVVIWVWKTVIQKVYGFVREFCIQPLYKYLVRHLLNVADTLFRTIHRALSYCLHKIEVVAIWIGRQLALYLAQAWQKLEALFVKYTWNWLLWPLRCLCCALWPMIKSMGSFVKKHCLYRLSIAIGFVIRKLGVYLYFLQQQLGNVCYDAWTSLQQWMRVDESRDAKTRF